MDNKKFSISDIELTMNEESIEFSYADIWFLAEGNNSHRNPISREVLKECANSILGKFLVYKIDAMGRDFQGHEVKEYIAGYFDPRKEVRFEMKDGKLFAVAEATISKIYTKEVVDLFRQDNQRAVSVEMLTIDGEKDTYGDTPILEFCITGVTILGKTIRPSCQNAEMKIKQFAENIESPLKQFAKMRKEGSEKMEEPIIVEETKVFEEQQEEQVQEEKELAAEETVEEEKETVECEEKAEEEVAETEMETKECEEEPQEEKEEDEEEQKEFSLDVNIDQAAYLQMLENETDEYKGLIAELWECKNYNLVMTKALECNKELAQCKAELAELKKYKETQDTKAKETAVEKELSEVKEDLSDDQIKQFQEEAKEYTIDNLSVWTNKLKAFAYEASKTNKKAQKKKDGITKIASDKQFEEDFTSRVATTPEDVFSKYLR